MSWLALLRWKGLPVRWLISRNYFLNGQAIWRDIGWSQQRPARLYADLWYCVYAISLTSLAFLVKRLKPPCRGIASFTLPRPCASACGKSAKSARSWVSLTCLFALPRPIIRAYASILRWRFFSAGLDDPEHTYHDVESALRRVILDQGGSLSHHHGVGKVRKEFLPQVHSANSMKVLRQTKHAMDPNNIFSAGNGAFGDTP